MTRFSSLFAAACLLGVACGAESPPRGPEALCVRSCESGARGCTPRECRMGCNLILDRLVEGQGGAVLACVAKRKKVCDDVTWAVCAARIGVHADGGPPPPPPPSDFEDEE